MPTTLDTDGFAEREGRALGGLILDWIKEFVGVDNHFSYVDVQSALSLTRDTAVRGLRSAAFLAHQEGLCIGTAAHGNEYTMVLTADRPELLTDGFLHIAQTRRGVQQREELQAEFMSEHAVPGSHEDLLAMAFRQTRRDAIENMRRERELAQWMLAARRRERQSTREES